MRFLPYDEITFETKLSEDEAIRRLSASVDPKGFIGLKKYFAGEGNPFIGKVEENTFKIIQRQTFGRRNSFSPVIKGVINDDYSVRKIYVEMRLSIYATLFFICWCGLLGILFFGIINTSNSGAFAVMPAVMIVFGCVLLMVIYKRAKAVAVKQLKELFQAEIVEEH